MRLSSVARTGISARSKILTSVGALAVAVVSVGICPGPQPTEHILGSWFEHCPDVGPVLSHFFLLTNPAGVNSANIDVTCEEFPSNTAQGILCQPEAGALGDGHVTVLFDWGSVGAFPGCPNPSGSGNGTARIYTHTVANDGSSVLTSLSFSTDFASYVVEMAHPYTGSEILPLACDDPARRLLRLDGASVSGSNVTADLTVFAPKISTDCDPGSSGVFVGVCTGTAPVAAVTAGRVYLQQGPCAAPPAADLRTPAWTFLSDSDAAGHAQVSFPNPAAGQCAFLGATYRLNGQEAPAIGGFLRVPTVTCTDADGDGITNCAGDCDDNDARRYPGNTEICDGVDNDCDGAVDEGLGTITCGRGRCARSVPACVGGVPRRCGPPGPPFPRSLTTSPEMCGPIGIEVVPVP